MNTEATPYSSRLPALACALVIVVFGLMIDLKGVHNDEGIRLAIMNGGQQFMPDIAGTNASWHQVLAYSAPYAYQPAYFLLQNSLMRVAQTHNVIFLRLVNVFFLWVSLQGLLALSKTWRLFPRLFLIGLFSCNAYLFMHVLQLREYILGVTFYVWSTWFVLHLDARKLDRGWADAGWFAAYGVLLTLGFYSQSWVVFPAIGQFIFLVVRPGRARGRCYVLLALCYAIVLSLTWPYLVAHHEKVDVGRWGFQGTSLSAQLSNGFHLVLSGHMTGFSPFTDFLFWFWLVVIAGAALLLFRPPATAGVARAEYKRQGALMLLSILVTLAFQIGYFLKVDNLSVWYRYFIIHYFFLTWLVALAFKYLCDLRAGMAVGTAVRSTLTVVVTALAALMIASGIYQTRSYYRDPYMDTGLSAASNWRTWATGLAHIIQPDDVVLTYDFLGRASLSFTRPIPNRIVPLTDLDTANLQAAGRLVYLENLYFKSQRSQLATRMAALGFGSMREIPIYSTDGTMTLSECTILTFSRR
ncbi:MAG: hypothetical protein DUW69_001936 [Verrucomicrobia bacterium]|nr:MAG: hypothetical protein DUW69_001936 [Verrucomicrobiota bacterium]